MTKWGNVSYNLYPRIQHLYNKDNKGLAPYKKRNWMKWLVIYFLIAILIYVGAYYLISKQNVKPYTTKYPVIITPQPTSTRDPTADWKTYRNSEFGFEVRYPKDWYVFSRGEGKIIEFSNEHRSAVGTQSEKAVLLQLEISQDTNLKEIFTALKNIKEKGTIGKDLVIYTKIADLQIDNLPAIRYVADRSAIPYIGLPIAKGIILQKGDTIFQFLSLGASDVALKEHKRTFDQILSTFRFVETKPVIPTDKISCETKGGKWDRFGLAQVWKCNLPTSDAGKECTDSSQCESVCIFDETRPNLEPPPGSNVQNVGKCYEWTETLGTCLRYVTNGKADGAALCVD